MDEAIESVVEQVLKECVTADGLAIMHSSHFIALRRGRLLDEHDGTGRPTFLGLTVWVDDALKEVARQPVRALDVAADFVKTRRARWPEMCPPGPIELRVGVGLGHLLRGEDNETVIAMLVVEAT